jgi:hypothetical protein
MSESVEFVESDGDAWTISRLRQGADNYLDTVQFERGSANRTPFLGFGMRLEDVPGFLQTIRKAAGITPKPGEARGSGIYFIKGGVHGRARFEEQHLALRMSYPDGSEQAVVLDCSSSFALHNSLRNAVGLEPLPPPKPALAVGDAILIRCRAVRSSVRSWLALAEFKNPAELEGRSRHLHEVDTRQIFDLEPEIDRRALAPEFSTEFRPSGLLCCVTRPQGAGAVVKFDNASETYIPPELIAASQKLNSPWVRW